MSVHVTVTPQRLRWTHFREVDAAPDPSAAAQTACLMQVNRISLGTEDGQKKLSQLVLQVSVDSANSWVVRGQATPALLDHERLHLRIAIQVAHEFNRELLAVRAPTVPDLQARIDRMRDEKAVRVQTISDAYDDASEHGRDGEEQRHWQVRVAGWEANHRVDF